MKISMQESQTSELLQFGNSDIAIIGRPVDDRGHSAFSYIKSKSFQMCSVEYDADNFLINIDGAKVNVDNIGAYFEKLNRRSIIMETTTLGFVEIFLCCRALKNNGVKQVKLIYVEPYRYNSPRRSLLLHKRDFELSEEFPGYMAIPGATIMLTDRSPQKGVFFLGYEERRLARALEDFQMIRSSNCIVVFGVPAFKPGWEMDAFANNIRIIRDKNIRGGVCFCGAENPAATVLLLEEIYGGLMKEERMFVAPIGTKPNGIGVALFVATHQNVGILYDHPKRREGRSESTGRWHIYEVEFE